MIRFISARWMVLVLGVAPYAAVAEPVSLTLIPPSPVTDRITLDVRGAVWNDADKAKTFDVAFYLGHEEEGSLLYRERLEVPAGSSKGVHFRWPTRNHAGRRQISFVATADGKAHRTSEPIEIIASDDRSTGRIDGAWIGIYHWSEAEGRLWNAEIKKMTDHQWHMCVLSGIIGVSLEKRRCGQKASSPESVLWHGCLGLRGDPEERDDGLQRHRSWRSNRTRRVAAVCRWHARDGGRGD